MNPLNLKSGWSLHAQIASSAFGHLICIAALTVAAVPAALASPNSPHLSENVVSAIRANCGKCHGDTDEVEGDVNLTRLNANNAEEDVELLRRMINVLDLKEMPPEDEPQPSPEQRRQMIAELTTTLNSAISQKKRFGHAPIRRMNRFQYNNAVVDLFDLRCIVFTLPERMMREHGGYFKPNTEKMADVVSVGSRPLGKSQMIEPRLGGVAAFPQDLRAEHGFDNRGDHLSLSPLLMESFLKLGQSITQSPQFDARNVGIWNEFFVAPKSNPEDTLDDVRNRLRTFLTRAFRKPIDPDALERYVDFVDGQLRNGLDFTNAMKSVAAATISSPRFLYLYDRSSIQDSPEQINSYELASKLSFFLWGSIPDEELLDLAESDQLKKQSVLLAQIDRMLHDRKLKRFCDSFPAQWLQLERIISSVPNRKKFPQFYFSKYRDSMHMMIEPLLLFETVLIENRPITQLIDPGFTYRSALLDDAYGDLRSQSTANKGRGGGVTVLRFNRVSIDDRRTGGVITNAAVMTMTSGPERTQPITRGAWIASVIFNNPPEPPPADVPPLGEKPAEGEEHLTLRERLALHRKRADCKGCHEQIDPLGFALENFDAIGNWRDTYENGRDVDVAGSLFRKREFSNVVEFKDAILAEKDRFTRALAGHLLSFALARELDATDQQALDKIASATASDDYRIKTLIKQVIISEPFQNKSNPKSNAAASNASQGTPKRSEES